MESSNPVVTDEAKLAALYEVSRVLGHSLNVDEALLAVMDAGIRLTRAERGFLMLIDENSGQLTFRLARNARQETLEEKQFEVSRSVVREVAASGLPVVTTNAQSDPRFSGQQSVLTYALRSVMAVPLMVRNKTIGVLYVDNKAKDAFFDHTALDLLHTFAGQAAVAIENARLYTRTDQALSARVGELEILQGIDRQLNTSLDFDEVMGLTLAQAIQYTEAESGWIGILENDNPDTEPAVCVIAGHGVEVGTRYPLTDPVLARALETGRPYHPPPNLAENIVVSLVAPIASHNKVLALIKLDRAEIDFSEEALKFLSRLADHAAIAIENARLYQAVKRAVDAKTKFVSVVTHELKIPMTSIKGYADLLRREMIGPLNEQQTQFLQIIRVNIERMAVLVTDLDDISRMDSGRFKLDLDSYDISPIVHEALTGLKTQIDAKSQNLVLNLPSHLPKILADKTRLIDVLTNLLNNAHKYSPMGGIITVAADVISNGNNQPSAVRVSIADTGLGITPEDKARLFTQFFRSDNPTVREQPGWGLGLHITKRLVEMQGGELSVQSDGVPGKGSLFAFTLPTEK